MRFLALTVLAFCLSASVASAALAPAETRTCSDPPRKILRTYDRESVPLYMAGPSGSSTKPSRFLYAGARRRAQAIEVDRSYVVRNDSDKGQISVRC